MADVGRLLHPGDREKLLAAIPPVYPRVVARHVAPEGGEPPDFPLPGEAEGFMVGVADDGAGVQALVVEIGGTTRRPDGSTYHVTRSLAPGRDAVESNDAIRERGWTPTPRPPPVAPPRSAVPTRCRSGFRRVGAVASPKPSRRCDMPEQARPEQHEGSVASAPPGRSPAAVALAAGVNNRLLERTREAIRGVGRQLAARRANLDRLTGKR